MKIVCYYRTSTKTNENGDSKKRQREICHTFAKNNGFEIIDEIHEVISGTIPVTERIKFLELLDEAETQGINKILFSDWSRFARSVLAQEFSLQYLNKRGFECISASNGITTDSEHDALIRNIFASIFQFEKDALVKKLRVARERIRKEKGKCEGRKGYWETDPEMVRIARSLRRKNPKTGKRRSFGKIAKMMLERGFANKSGEILDRSVVMGMCS